MLFDQLSSILFVGYFVTAPFSFHKAMRKITIDIL